jgi:hypothetical protein
MNFGGMKGLNKNVKGLYGSELEWSMDFLFIYFW